MILAGGSFTGWMTSMIVRKSQKESTQISLLLGLVDQLQEERDAAITERERLRIEIPKWRRHTRELRSQIYELGAVPKEPGTELDY